MPVVYRVKHDGEENRTASFFAKKGEASKFKRSNKDKSPDDLEALKVSGREGLCALLNDPYGYDPEGGSDMTGEDDNEFL